MALRRVLPSRATPDKTPESAAAPASTPPAQSSKPPRRPLAETHIVPPPAEVTYDMPAGLPNSAAENTLAPVAAQTGSESFAAAATSAFGTLPTAAPARVLEDSFVKAPATEPASSEPTLGPAALADSISSFSAPAWESGSAPAPEPDSAPAEEPAPVFTAPAFDVPSSEPTLGPAALGDSASGFSAPAWEGVNQITSAPAEPATPEPAPAVEPAPEPGTVVMTASVMAAPMPAAEEAAAPVAAEEAKPAPQPEPGAAPAPAQPAAFQPSRPENNQFKRKVRDKKPRDLTAMGSPEDQKPVVNTPNTAFAPTVPVHTKPLEKVDEDLIATGIMEGPAADSLTGSLPTGVAEMTFTPPVQPAAQAVAGTTVKVTLPEPAPLPALAPVPVPVPAAIPEPVAVSAPAPDPVAIPVPQPIQPPPPPAPKAPQPVAAPIPMPEPAPTPESAPAVPIPTPSFLSNAAPAPAASAPLPPPQSDLPWTQRGAADWEIESPENEGWAPDTGHETPAAGASHMPPPTDLYKGMGSNSVPPSMPSSGLPPRTGTNFTPELPGQRKKSGGSPWVLIATVVLVVAGAGAWYLHGRGSNQSQQQLANLTKPSTAPVTPDGALLPPPDVAVPNTANASFYSPPSHANVATPADTSSSAVVAFADVPPEQANQPIVATGNEDIPPAMNLMDKFKAEVEKARAAKAAGASGEAAGMAASASATTPIPAPTATGAITPDKLQEELAAYRNALANSPTPITPSAFRKDPDGYMDGKPQQAAQTGTPTGQPGADGQMASGALLPPPDLYTNNPKNLPVVAEPVANTPPRIRTLADFPDIQPYAPEREKVEIPKNLKPKMAATDFPALEVLSFVPGKGIVAYADGREGVLLIGESINGWELVNVTPDNAQFKAGEKSYQVSADN